MKCEQKDQWQNADHDMAKVKMSTFFKATLIIGKMNPLHLSMECLQTAMQKASATNTPLKSQ